MSDERTTGILVGLDGSQGSVATLQKAISVEHDGHLVVRPESALECALRDPVLSGIAAIALAKSMHAEIVAVHLFESPYPALAPGGGGAPMGVGGEAASIEESVCERVEETFRTAGARPEGC